MPLRTPGSKGIANLPVPDSSVSQGPVVVGKSTALPAWIVGIIAAGFVIGFGFFVHELVGIARTPGTEELMWNRLMALFVSVESLVFAAAGWIFGTSVERRRTDAAVANLAVSNKSLAHSDKSRQQMQDAMETMRMNGQELRVKLEALALHGSSEASGGRAEAAEILGFAEQVFPRPKPAASI